MSGNIVLELPFLAEVRLKLGKHAQHVEERLARRRPSVDRLLRRPQHHALRFQLMHDVLEILHRPGQPVDPRHNQGVA